DEVVTSRMIGSTMNASSRPLSSQVTTPNQPIGQLRAGRRACVVVTWSLCRRTAYLPVLPAGGWPLGGKRLDRRGNLVLGVGQGGGDDHEPVPAHARLALRADHEADELLTQRRGRCAGRDGQPVDDRLGTQRGHGTRGVRNTCGV